MLNKNKAGSNILVIVESPAKAATIKRYLGNQYVVKASVGHILDLPRTSKDSTLMIDDNTVLSSKDKALIKRMGINPYDRWKAHYAILPGKARVVSDLKALAKQADLIYLATDRDREGEAIAWHLQSVLKGDAARYRRVIFNEITKKAIQQAFSQPLEAVDLNKVHAQQTRRYLDRVVGFMLSPLLWEKVGRQLSAGRVQSVAVRLLAEREHTIKQFLPKTYWEVDLNLKTEEGEAFKAKVISEKGTTQSFESEQSARTIAALFLKQTLPPALREIKRSEIPPPKPLITSTLQQVGSARLNLSIKRTMYLAQRLYEAGYITYMRTDSTHLSADALADIDQYLQSHFSVAPNPTRLDSKKAVKKKASQEAHEAIRPANFGLLPAALSGIDEEGKKLYELIWKQTLASQMPPAVVETQTLQWIVGSARAQTKFKCLVTEGWMHLLPPPKDRYVQNPDTLTSLGSLPTFCDAAEVSKHFTRPSPRYTEATLVKELEKQGIGRPSTYAEILSTIQERGYVRLVKRRFFVEKLGEVVTDRLIKNFHELLNPEFSADLEDQLDAIAQGKADWIDTLDSFFKGFLIALEKARLPEEQGGMEPNRPILTSLACPNCQQALQIKVAKTGVFIGCSSYQNNESACRFTLGLSRVFDIEPEDEGASVLTQKRCKLCSQAMDRYALPDGSDFWLCGNSPQCKSYDCEARITPACSTEKKILSSCERCERGALIQKRGRFGEYAQCDQCENTRKIVNGELAPARMPAIPIPSMPCERTRNAYFVLREGAAGLFLAANTFPKSRETRAPLIKELKLLEDRLPEKWHYLLQAPEMDPQGFPTIVRFSRKLKTVYVGSLKAGKPTPVQYDYKEGGWVLSEKAK